MPISQELEQVLEETTESLKACPETVGVIFHGSHQRGDAHAESDVDILCVTDADWLSLEVREISGYKVEIQRNPLRKVQHDVHRDHPANNNFYLTALISGEVLYQRDGALEEVLRGAREVWEQKPTAAEPFELELCRNSLRNRLKTLRHMQDDPEAQGLMRVLADVLFYRAIHDYCKIHRKWCMKFSLALAAIEHEAPEIHRRCQRFLQADNGPEWLVTLEDLIAAILEPVGWGEPVFDTGRKSMTKQPNAG